MIVGIVGSRTRNSEKDWCILCWRLAELEEETGETIIKIVTGDCKVGGDRFARKIARHTKGIKLDIKEAILPPYGSDYFLFVNAYYRRDEEIAKEEMDYLIALVTPDRKGGTEKTMEYFKEYHEDWEDKLILI